MSSSLCAAFILATCALTFGLIDNSNPLPPVAKLTISPYPANNASSSTDQCRCSGRVGADGSCFAYNKKWQANTVDEAIEFFRNPLDVDQTKPSAMTNEEKQRVKAFFKDSEPNEPIDTCEKDEKCTFCLSGVYYLLAVRASYSDLNQKTWADLYNEIVRRLAGSGIPFALVRDKCKQSPDKVMNNQATSNVYNEVLRTLSCNTCMQQYLTSSTNNVNTDSRNRAKRQTIGTTFTVQCYRRGQLIGDGTNYVGMCNLCWTVRQLPAQYTPRMLNEVSCTSDTTCLAGYGTCRARYRATNVMYNQVEVSINAQSGCECQVNLGSPFYAYVSA